MTKCITAILLLLISASFALSFQKRDEWIKYSSPEGRYSVSLPAQPNLSTQEATTADGQKFPQYLASVTEAGDVVFLTGYFDSVPGTIFSADAARDGMVKQINGTLINETALSLGNYPGRGFKVLAKAPAGASAEGEKPAEPVDYIVHARFYEVDKRVYVLQVIFPKSLESEAINARATKYFDSFQVVKNQID
ncbi:MAG TPA: hypothetical protein VF899_02660 [Pyrinomonadaceae bacterium]